MIPTSSQWLSLFSWSVLVLLWLYLWGEMFRLPARQFFHYLRNLWLERFKDILREASHALQDLRDLIRVGVFPPSIVWERVRALQAPWGSVFFPVLMQLREQGTAMVPTLDRWIDWLELSRVQSQKAQSRASQVRLQLRILIATIPLLIAVLPQFAQQPMWDVPSWWMICALALCLGGAGLWILERQVQSALRGRVAQKRQRYPFWIQTAGELVLAWIQAGLPGDVAWSRAHRWLEGECPALADEWGGTIWGPSPSVSESSIRSLRECIEWSVVEGTPVSERLGILLEQLRQSATRKIDKSLEELPTQALLPLFATVGPANLIILGYVILQPGLEFLGADALAGSGP